MAEKQTIELLHKTYRVLKNPALNDPLNMSDFVDRVNACKTLIKADHVLQKWAVLQCNGIARYDAKARMILQSWTDKDDSALQRTRTRESIRIDAAMRVLFGAAVDQLTVEIGGDPRGAAIKVYMLGRSDPLFWV